MVKRAVDVTRLKRLYNRLRRASGKPTPPPPTDATDEAVLALAPMPTGHETTFDVLPARAARSHHRLADAGPDLSHWEVALNGKLAPALAGILAAIASDREGAAS